MAFSPNSAFLYAIAVIVVLFVLAQSVFFLVRSYRRGKELGLSAQKLKKTIISTTVFTIAPAISILLGVITLSKFLGLPFPWLRLSVLGALTYELPAATTTAAAIGLSTSEPVASAAAFASIAWVMTLGIIPGIFLVLFGLKKIQGSVNAIRQKDGKWGGIFMDSLFMGMISAFTGLLFADIRLGVPGFIPLAVALVSALIMGVCGVLIKVCKIKWLEQYAMPISMLGAMAASIPLTALMGGAL